MNTRKNVTALYFSPTHSTQGIVEKIAKSFSTEYQSVDLSSSSFKSRSFTSDDIVVIGIPVYSGRVPLPAIEKIKQFRADNSLTITVAVYGNRDYDDALLELNDVCSEQGFMTIASAAFIAEHSINRAVAKGRPNLQDLEILERFCKQVSDKMASQATTKPTVKGNFPYKERVPLPIFPITTQSCSFCGKCIEICPTNAISDKTAIVTDPELCITCMRCIDECPEQARELNISPTKKLQIEEGLAAKCTVYREPELFF